MKQYKSIVLAFIILCTFSLGFPQCLINLDKTSPYIAITVENIGTECLETTTYYDLTVSFQRIDLKTGKQTIISKKAIDLCPGDKKTYYFMPKESQGEIKKIALLYKPTTFFEGYNNDQVRAIVQKEENKKYSLMFPLNYISVHFIFGFILTCIVFYLSKTINTSKHISVLSILFILGYFYLSRYQLFNAQLIHSFDEFIHFKQIRTIVATGLFDPTVLVGYPYGYHIILSSLTLITGSFSSLHAYYLLHLINAIIVFLMCRHLKFSKAASFISILFFLQSPRLFDRTVQLFPEMLSYTFMFLALYMIMKEDTKKNIALYGLFLLCTAFTNISGWSSAIIFSSLIAFYKGEENPSSTMRIAAVMFIVSIFVIIGQYSIISGNEITYFKIGIVASIGLFILSYLFYRISFSQKHFHVLLIGILVAQIFLFHDRLDIFPIINSQNLTEKKLAYYSLNQSLPFILLASVFIVSQHYKKMALPILLTTPYLLWYIPSNVSLPLLSIIPIKWVKARAASMCAFSFALLSGYVLDHFLSKKQAIFSVSVFVMLLLGFQFVYDDMFNLSPVPQTTNFQKQGIKNVITFLDSNSIDSNILWWLKAEHNPIVAFTNKKTTPVGPYDQQQYCNQGYTFVYPRFAPPVAKCWRPVFQDGYFIIFQS